MLGAKGVQMGTHFVVTDESQVHENYKERIIKAKDIDSRVTGRTTGHPVRALRNDMTEKISGTGKMPEQNSKNWKSSHLAASEKQS